MKIISKPVTGLPPLSQADRDQLAESIRLHGVLVPLLITHQGVLIDGEERWLIIQAQGIRVYPLRVFGRMTEAERLEMAYRVNLERRHLTRAERSRLLVAYIQSAPEQSSRAIGAAMGVSQRTAADAKKKVSGSAHLPTLGRDGKRYRPRPAASSAETTQGATVLANLMDSLDDGEIEGGTTPRNIKKRIFDAAREEYGKGTPATLPEDFRLILGDYQIKSKLIGSDTVDLGMGDPPWSWEEDQLAPFMETYRRILKPGSLLATYCGVGQIAEMMRAAEANGLAYWWSIACQNPPSQMITRKAGMVRSLHRTVLIFRKPGALTRKAKHWITDSLNVDYDAKKYHQWEQPLQESIEMLRGLARPGWLVADLTTGSGSSGVACARQGLRWIGIEKDAQTYQIAKRRISEVIKETPTMAGAKV